MNFLLCFHDFETSINISIIYGILTLKPILLNFYPMCEKLFLMHYSNLDTFIFKEHRHHSSYHHDSTFHLSLIFSHIRLQNEEEHKSTLAMIIVFVILFIVICIHVKFFSVSYKVSCVILHTCHLMLSDIFMKTFFRYILCKKNIIMHRMYTH